jgi:regulatory protein
VAEQPSSGPEADPVEVARLIVLRRLERGPRTRAQLEQACARRNVPEWAVTQLLDRFAELGLVDDEAYARAWVRSRHAGRGLGRRALRHELLTRGVDRDVIDEAVAEITSDDEDAAARALVRARRPGLARYDRTTQRRRLVALLARRGYSAAVAAAVVAREMAADDDARGQDNDAPGGDLSP